MKRLLIVLVVLAAVAGGLVAAYLAMRGEREAEAEAEAPVVAASRATRGPGGETVLKLDAATQSRIGLRLAKAAAGSVAVEWPAAVRVLDPGPLAAAVREVAGARLELDAAVRDHERKRSLFENGRNASAAAVEQAAVALERARLAGDVAREHLTTAWGPALAAREDLATLAQSLVRREAALVRLDLLPSEVPLTPPASARLVRADGRSAGDAAVLGSAPSTDSALAGRSYLALVSAATNAAALAVGAVLEARVAAGPERRGTVLPAEAVLRHAGLGWVYVQTGPESFTRRAVPLETPHPDGWLVPGEWPEPLVVSGGQSLLSEELKASIQMVD
jgi:hypothetical protein